MYARTPFGTNILNIIQFKLRSVCESLWNVFISGASPLDSYNFPVRTVR